MVHKTGIIILMKRLEDTCRVSTPIDQASTRQPCPSIIIIIKKEPLNHKGYTALLRPRAGLREEENS